MFAFDPSSVAIACITLYPKWYQGKLKSISHTDKIRGDLALEFVRMAKEMGYQVVIVNGKSEEAFSKELSKIRGIHILKRYDSSASSDRRKVVEIASGLSQIKVIILCEPEKTSFLSGCIDKILKPLLENKADIVVPKRQTALFKLSYPKYMFESEREGNVFYNEALKANGLLITNSEDFDMFFGPRAFVNKQEVVKLFMRKYEIGHASFSFAGYSNTERFSNSLFFPIVSALKESLKVQSVTVPFVYPKIQKENEEKGARELFLEKRRSQRLGLLVELLHFISYLEKNKGSGLKRI